MRGGRIAAVVARDLRTGRRVRLAGRLFADCTGDGAVGALAGADFEITRAGHMGPSNLWNVVDTGRVKLPFGIAQIGKSFRNEITPGNFIFRTREFEQMEMEYFVEPGTQRHWRTPTRRSRASSSPTCRTSSTGPSPARQRRS